MYKIDSFKVNGFRFVIFLNYAAAIFDHGEHKFCISSRVQPAAHDLLSKM
jgi:hypothetical protein